MAKILVVEDSPTQAARLEHYLIEHGLDTITANDAEAALEFLEHTHFDLVISDIVMPGMSGYDLCRRIKSTSRWKETPVILLTSLRDPMDIVLGLEAGADNFFTKPFEPEQLIKRVNSVLESRKLVSEGKLRVGFEVSFLGKRFSITSDRQQILDLLISTFEQIIETNQQLERRKEELALARDQAEAATLAKANFLAAMSHEIRTPMNGIVGMVDLLSEAELSDDQRKMIATIKSSAYSLLGIIGDILDFSKLEAGRMRLDRAPISINDVLESVGIAFWPSVIKKSLIMPMFCDPRIPSEIWGDEVRIRQILSNLIGNAVKFVKTTPDRMGKIVVKAELIAEVMDRVQVRFSVSDNGIGISDEVKSRLFRPFEQADASTVRQYGGTGLGLSICKQLVVLMDGQIALESEPGVGTTFSVDLWFDGAEEKARFADLSGIRVLNLLSNTKSEFAEFLMHYVTYWNGEAEAVFDRESCLACLKESVGTSKKFDVVVISSRLSTEEQINLRDEIVAIPELSSTRFIFMNADYQRAPRLTDVNTMSLTAAPLCYPTYITAIAIASGRASPATQMLVEEKILPNLQAPSVEEAGASGQLILVAEDNEVNQDVLRRQLTRLGYAAVIVNDGMQALDAYRTGQFGLLLTDCHMPVMDGYQLTTTIRAEEQGTDRHIPIIAITANALHGEAERCLAIGMDDFVVKPVELRAFRTKLDRWMPASGASPVNTEQVDNRPWAAPQNTSDKAIFDMSALERLIGDDPKVLGEILRGFEAPARRTVADIGAAFDAHQIEQIAFGAHKLKSSARTIGGDTLSDMCVALEEAGKSEDWSTIARIAPELNGALNNVVACIDAKLTELDRADV